MISFLPILSGKFRAKKIRILYFVVQSVGSLLILTGGAIADRTSLFSKWVAIGLVLKASMAPLHFWGAVVITKLKKLIVYVLLT